MNKNYLYAGIVVVVLLIAGGGYAFKHEIKTVLTGNRGSSASENSATNTSVPTVTVTEVPESATQTIVEVDYVASGMRAFNPSEITIKKGTTVKFVNKSGGTMDVASNPHPVHTDYPGFDQGKSAQAGQNEYDFTFTKVGTWGFHNHLNPSDGGTVVVTD